jgi:threonine dehydratase
MLRCMDAGRVVDVPEEATLSESTAGGLEPESVTLPLCRAVIDRPVLVSEAEILAAMKSLLATEHWVVEGAAGVALAAFIKESRRYRGKRAAVVLCGRNLSPAALAQVMS